MICVRFCRQPLCCLVHLTAANEHDILGSTMRILAMALIGAAAAASCTSANAISSDRAAVERAAIHQDLRNDTATLFKIASERAKRGKPELRGRQVVCAIADIQTT